MATVFLCHASADKAAFVRRFAMHLKDCGHEPFLDESCILAGQSISQEVAAATEKCDYFIVIVSRKSNRSQWVQREFNSTIARRMRRRNKRIIICRIERCRVPALVSDMKHIDFFPSYESGMVQLLQAFQGDATYAPPWAEPKINYAIDGTKVRRIEPRLKVLAAPARRPIEVLVKAPDGVFYRQGAVEVGNTTSKCTFGRVVEAAGTPFEIYLLTTFLPLLVSDGTTTEMLWDTMPPHQTCSDAIKVFRAAKNGGMPRKTK